MKDKEPPDGGSRLGGIGLVPCLVVASRETRSALNRQALKATGVALSVLLDEQCQKRSAVDVFSGVKGAVTDKLSQEAELLVP